MSDSKKIVYYPEPPEKFGDPDLKVDELSPGVKNRPEICELRQRLEKHVTELFSKMKIGSLTVDDIMAVFDKSMEAAEDQKPHTELDEIKTRT